MALQLLGTITGALKPKSKQRQPKMPVILSDDLIEYHRGVLEYLVALGTSEEITDVKLTSEQVEHLSPEDVEKYHKDYIAFIEEKKNIIYPWMPNYPGSTTAPKAIGKVLPL